MNVDRIYTREVVRVPRSSSVGEAAGLMSRHNVGFLLVTEDTPAEEQVVGVVTDRDLVVEALAEGLGPDDVKVEDIMKARLSTVAADADLHEALALMNRGGFRRLAVTDGGNHIVGVLSVDDVIDGIASDLAGVAGVMRIERRPAGSPAA